MRWTRIGGMTGLVVTLAIALALSLGLWSHWTASAQDTFIVNDDTAPADGGCATPDFLTEDIQDAVDSGLVADGDTLVICEGTYNPPDAIEVTKSLTIEGRPGADRDDIVVQGAAGEDGFVLSVDGVTMRHLKLVGAGPDMGVNVTSDENILDDLEVSAWGYGLEIGFVDRITITDNDVHDNSMIGIEIDGGVDNAIQRNISSANQIGIDVADGDNLLIADNVLVDNTVSQIRLETVFSLNVRIVRNQVDTMDGTGDGVHIKRAPADAFIQIGGSPENANTFSGDFNPSAGGYYVELVCTSENTVDATYNWWGSTNRTDIANRIFNDEDDPTPGVECTAPDDVKGAVVFHPWASGPAPTPTPSPTPTATGTPTATATGTPTPTATPGATRTIDLSPPGWQDLAWSGANGTDPGVALACIAGKYSIAYAWEGPTTGFKRWVEGCAIPGICNMSDLNKYDTMLVNVSAASTSCVMPVAP